MSRIITILLIICMALGGGYVGFVAVASILEGNGNDIIADNPFDEAPGPGTQSGENGICSHNWGNWLTSVPATQSTTGQQYRVCLLNPAHIEYKTIEKLPNLAHELDDPYEPYSYNHEEVLSLFNSLVNKSSAAALNAKLSEYIDGSLWPQYRTSIVEEFKYADGFVQTSAINSVLDLDGAAFGTQWHNVITKFEAIKEFINLVDPNVMAELENTYGAFLDPAYKEYELDDNGNPTNIEIQKRVGTRIGTINNEEIKYKINYYSETEMTLTYNSSFGQVFIYINGNDISGRIEKNNEGSMSFTVKADQMIFAMALRNEKRVYIDIVKRSERVESNDVNVMSGMVYEYSGTLASNYAEFRKVLGTDYLTVAGNYEMIGVGAVRAELYESGKLLGFEEVISGKKYIGYLPNAISGFTSIKHKGMAVNLNNLSSNFLSSYSDGQAIVRITTTDYGSKLWFYGVDLENSYSRQIPVIYVQEDILFGNYYQQHIDAYIPLEESVIINAFDTENADDIISKYITESTVCETNKTNIANEISRLETLIGEELVPEHKSALQEVKSEIEAIQAFIDVYTDTPEDRAEYNSKVIEFNNKETEYLLVQIYSVLDENKMTLLPETVESVPSDFRAEYREDADNGYEEFKVNQMQTHKNAYMSSCKSVLNLYAKQYELDISKDYIEIDSENEQYPFKGYSSDIKNNYAIIVSKWDENKTKVTKANIDAIIGNLRII